MAKRNGQHVADDRAERLARYLGHDEEEQAVGRRDQADHDVDHDDDAEVDGVDAECVARSG